MKIVGRVNTTLYGKCLVGEDAYGQLHPISTDDSATENWIEITNDEWMKNFSIN